MLYIIGFIITLLVVHAVSWNAGYNKGLNAENNLHKEQSASREKYYEGKIATLERERAGWEKNFMTLLERIEKKDSLYKFK